MEAMKNIGIKYCCCIISKVYICLFYHYFLLLINVKFVIGPVIIGVRKTYTDNEREKLMISPMSSVLGNESATSSPVMFEPAVSDSLSLSSNPDVDVPDTISAINVISQVNGTKGRIEGNKNMGESSSSSN